jgi:hypothetical protein
MRGYQRGHEDGSILARLDGHDQHFAHLNGSMQATADALGQVHLSLQRLADEAVARDRTVITTAAALKDAETVRREKSTTSWTPLTRIAAGVTALVGALTLALFLRYGIPTAAPDVSPAAPAAPAAPTATPHALDFTQPLPINDGITT